MSFITVVYDASREAQFQEKILPLLADRDITTLAFDSEHLPDLAPGETVLTWLDDAALTELLPKVIEHEWKLGIIPHPELVQARIGLRIAAKPEDAIRDIFESGEGTVVDSFTVMNDPYSTRSPSVTPSP